MFNLKNLSKGIAVSLASVVLLTACGGDAEAPEAVIPAFQENLVAIETFDTNVNFSFLGKDQVDNMNFQLDANVKGDQTDPAQQKAAVDLKANVTLTSAEATTQGNMGVNFLINGTEFLFKLGEFNFKDPSIAPYLPIIESYKDRWLKLSSDFLPGIVSSLANERTDEMIEMEEKAKQFFVEADLFDVTKEYGTETVNGRDSYHYQVSLNQEGMTAYLNQLGSLMPDSTQTLQPADMDELFNSIKSIDLWIGKEDHQLSKGIINLMADNAESQGASFDISLTILANSYNKPVSIEVPAEFEEFDPLSLMMGLSGQMNSEVPAESDAPAAE
ncbi:hypothetical protein IPJ72_04520 [Candidatus Peregrinibacteria bacterium]|nr:MAG: hypothetical protein IPJ72_04520 [Candidatus Peregrinibacteria bacterium]